MIKIRFVGISVAGIVGKKRGCKCKSIDSQNFLRMAFAVLRLVGGSVKIIGEDA